MKTYAEKLKDPRWQRKRLEIMERDEFKCRHCRSKEKTLNVHHKIYRKGKMPWDYEDAVFVTLCEQCHKKAEENKEVVLLAMGQSHQKDVEISAVAVAISGVKQELTYWGWAGESLAYCVLAQLLRSRPDIDAQNEINDSSLQCIRNICKAVESSEKANGL
jgi:hypothetical protein